MLIDKIAILKTKNIFFQKTIEKQSTSVKDKKLTEERCSKASCSCTFISFSVAEFVTFAFLLAYLFNRYNSVKYNNGN